MTIDTSTLLALASTVGGSSSTRKDTKDALIETADLFTEVAAQSELGKFAYQTGLNTDYTVLAADCFLSFTLTANRSCTLPAANTVPGKLFIIQKVDATTSVLNIQSASTIHTGFLQNQLVQQGSVALVFSDGAAYTLYTNRHIFGVRSWTPTCGASGSMTYSSVSTIGLYREFGELVWFALQTDGTTGGTASTALHCSLPLANGSSSGHLIRFNAMLRDATSGNISTRGIARASLSTDSPASTLIVHKSDFANWGLGAGRQIDTTGWYRRA